MQQAVHVYREQMIRSGWPSAASVALQTLVVWYFFAVAHALRIPLGLSACFLMVPLCTLVQTVPVSFNGWGVRESLFVVYFGQVGLPRDSALAFSLVGAGLIVLLSLSGALVWASRAHRPPRTPPPERGEPLSVLHVCDKFGVKGSSIHGVSRLFSWWFPRYDGARFRVSLCGLKSPEPAPRLLEDEGIPVRHLGRGRFDPRILGDLVSLAREREARVLHVHGYAAADFGRLAARRVGAPPSSFTSTSPTRACPPTRPGRTGCSPPSPTAPSPSPAPRANS